MNLTEEVRISPQIACLEFDNFLKENFNDSKNFEISISKNFFLIENAN